MGVFDTEDESEEGDDANEATKATVDAGFVLDLVATPKDERFAKSHDARNKLVFMVGKIDEERKVGWLLVS